MTDLHYIKDLFMAKNISDLEYEYEETKLEVKLNLFQLEEALSAHEPFSKVHEKKHHGSIKTGPSSRQ